MHINTISVARSNSNTIGASASMSEECKKRKNPVKFCLYSSILHTDIQCLNRIVSRPRFLRVDCTWALISEQDKVLYNISHSPIHAQCINAKNVKLYFNNRIIIILLSFASNEFN